MKHNRIALVSALGVSACLLAGSVAGYVITSTHAVFDALPTVVDERVTPTPTPTVDLPVNEHGNVPPCTDAIADAGGICWGSGPVTVVGEPAVVKASDPAPAAVTAPADLPPCAVEDADNCYWDAATMGNGTGRSFVTLHGVTYYADEPAPERRTVDLNGTAYPYVDGLDAILYCEQPLAVGIDVDDQGNEWAGCM